MSFYTNLRTDYSSLFSSMSGGSNSSSNLLSNINLTDYYNIKSGNYYKLVKAYYAKNADTKTDKTTTDRKNKAEDKTTSESAKLKNNADTLYDAAEKLTATGSKSLFNKKTVTSTSEDGRTTTKTDYDRDTIQSAVQGFIKGYNNLVSSAGKSDNTSVKRTAQSMIDLSAVFSKQLDRVGISVGMDGKLTMDSDSFAKADMSKVKTLFNGVNSFADSVGGYASSIRNYAKSDLNSGNTYDQLGKYSSLQNGLNFNSFF